MLTTLTALISAHPTETVTLLVAVTIGLPIISLVKQALGIGVGSNIYHH
jgi:hypothetical protein